MSFKSQAGNSAQTEGFHAQKYGHALVASTRLVSQQVPRLTPRPAESNKTARIKRNCVLQVFRARAQRLLRPSDLQVPRLLRAS